ncbi:MAG: M3 family metallopeptidase [Cyclobacteriaceae bacterium]|nr:M3 family metallopeptidase [Cyclobacteriaceae bacterium HetDA_MAG_MS6]
MTEANPLLTEFDTPFEVPPFDAIKVEHFLPAIRLSMDQAKSEIDDIIANSDPASFENTIEKLEASGESLQRNASVLFNLNSAETSKELQQVAQEISPVLTEFDSEIKQNEGLFARVKTVYESRSGLDLSVEQKMLLEKTYKSFVRSGSNLDTVAKNRFREVSMELSKLTLKFGENVLKETNDYELVIEKESDLSGLPQDVIDRAASLAKENEHAGKWVFTLQAPSYIPFMEYADNRTLREQLFKAYMSKAFKGNDHDNQELIRKIVALRSEKSNLLGYKTYADYVLEERMAETPLKVKSFLNDLLEKSMPAARKEVDEIKAFMKEQGVDHELQRWDWAYYSEKLRKKKYEFDDELIKPYFELERVIAGVFETAGKLFGLAFERKSDIPVYHPDVQAYEVRDRVGNMVAVFLADFFPRAGKRPGAWMTSFREEKRKNGNRIIPQVSIVCNFTPSSEGNPSLLKFDEVKTLFHEFGHALHGMLANTTYGSLSGTSVYWDFVELPSQIFENWCYEKECLDLFARHYQTGELIPQELIEKLRSTVTYHEAYATVRQLSFALLDMAYHYDISGNSATIGDVAAFEQEAMNATELFPLVDGVNMSVQFGHIFAGGYAAGYYSYKWAEVLDADAFSLFQERGIFDAATAVSFQENILSKGGTVPPMELYKRFRGQEPTADALLKRAGLVR